MRPKPQSFIERGILQRNGLALVFVPGAELGQFNSKNMMSTVRDSDLNKISRGKLDRACNVRTIRKPRGAC